MKNLAEFVQNHITDDTTRLILDREKWSGIDMDIAVNCIESRRKLKGKVQEWYDNPELIFPKRLSAEQCSSSHTAAYKAEVADRILRADTGKDCYSVADITGGLGVDSWYFSRKASRVLYNEMQPDLAEAARHNFTILGAENLEVSNICITDGREPVLQEFKPDLIYMDPARRGEGGKKVFLMEECSPDVLKLKENLFMIARHIMIKLSPMADISMVCNRLGKTCREVHVISSGGECKELLIIMDREWEGEYTVVATEIHNDGTSSCLRYIHTEEKSAKPVFYRDDVSCSSICGHFLFEPGKSLMKSGAFNLISERFGISKLGSSTHYYITPDNEKAEHIREFGKVFRILECTKLDRKGIKYVGKQYPQAEVTARNIPMNTETLGKKLGVSSGGHAHIFGIRSDFSGNLLIVCKKF